MHLACIIEQTVDMSWLFRNKSKYGSTPTALSVHSSPCACWYVFTGCVGFKGLTIQGIDEYRRTGVLNEYLLIVETRFESTERNDENSLI